MENNAAFMELVQLHERMWGTEQYSDRPSLADLINAPIVVIWMEIKSHRDIKRGDPRADYFMFTVHKNTDELSVVLMEALMAGKVTMKPCRKISKVFVNQQLMKIKAVRLVAEKPSS